MHATRKRCTYRVILSQSSVLRRLEDHEELQGMECLEQFDQRLANAVKTLKELGKWDELVNSGGSSAHALALSSCEFDKEVGQSISNEKYISLIFGSTFGQELWWKGVGIEPLHAPCADVPGVGYL